VPLIEKSTFKELFNCELLTPSTTLSERPVKVVVNAESFQIRDLNSDQILENWPFQKIRTWNVARHYFSTNELILDLTPYSDQPLIVASGQAILIMTSLRMAVTKRAKEIKENQSAKPIEFSYVAVQKFSQKIKKKIILEITNIGIRVVGDNILGFIPSEVVAQRNLADIKTVYQVGEDEVIVQFGSVEDKYAFASRDPKAIIDAFQRVMESKVTGGDVVSESSSEDTDV